MRQDFHTFSANFSKLFGRMLAEKLQTISDYLPRHRASRYQTMHSDIFMILARGNDNSFHLSSLQANRIIRHLSSAWAEWEIFRNVGFELFNCLADAQSSKGAEYILNIESVAHLNIWVPTKPGPGRTIWFKGTNVQIHKYKDTKTQIQRRKDTNTQRHKDTSHQQEGPSASRGWYFQLWNLYCVPWQHCVFIVERDFSTSFDSLLHYSFNLNQNIKILKSLSEVNWFSRITKVFLIPGRADDTEPPRHLDT